MCPESGCPVCFDPKVTSEKAVSLQLEVCADACDEHASEGCRFAKPVHLTKEDEAYERDLPGRLL